MAPSTGPQAPLESPSFPQLPGSSPAWERGVHCSSLKGRSLGARAWPLGLQPLPLLLFPTPPPSLCCRRSIRSMSQRRKGPGRPPTSSTISSLSPAPPPRARAVLLPLSPKHEIFLCSEAPPRSLCWCLSICLSHLPASNPGAWTGPGLLPHL